jgi:putative ABC transport system permease protein
MASLHQIVAPVLRMFRRDASTVIPSVAILGLGLGANIAIFAVAYAVLLRPLPIEDQQSVVVMWERADKEATSVWEVSYRDFKDWDSQNASFTQLAATGSVNWSARLILKDGPVVLPFAAVSGSFFGLLGAQASVGRPLTPADDHRSGAGVVVLSDRTWRDQFGSDPGAVGRTAMIDDGAGVRAMTILGVMPPEFDYPRGAALWLPIAPTLGRLSSSAGFDMLEERGLGILYVLGRLKTGATIEQARADMNTIVDRLTASAGPGTGRSIVVTTLVDFLFGHARPALLLLIAAAMLVLFLTCANVVGLLLARLSSRRRDLAIQLALGATGRTLLSERIVESAILVTAGMLAAIVIAMWSIPFLTALAPQTVPRLDSVRLGTAASTAFSLGIAVVATLACGLLPLLIVLPRTHRIVIGRPEVISRAGTPSTRTGLVVGQTAIAVVLLVGAALTVRSFHGIRRVQVGFDPASLVTFDVGAPPDKYPKDKANDRFYRPALERVRTLPGVADAAAVQLRPFEFGPIGSGVAVLLDGQSPRDRSAWRGNPTLNAEAVSPNYFSVMGIRLLQGRMFTEQDTRDSPAVVIISLSAARRLWPGANPIGKRLMTNYDWPVGGWQTVVGVVGDVKYRGLTEATLDLYKPYLQSDDGVKHFIVKPSGLAAAPVERLRRQIRELEPLATVDAIRSMREVVDRQLDPWRFTALLFSLLAALALIVAAVGLYALLAHHVEDRVREIGIRVALGARRLQILRLFAGRIARLTVGGIVIGLVAAGLGSQAMRSVLFEVEPVDALSYAAVALLLVVSATAGACWPMRRAISVDPLVALKHD